MIVGHADMCPYCRGSGVIDVPIDYPDLPNQRCCTHCSAGAALAETISKIVNGMKSNEHLRSLLMRY